MDLLHAAAGTPVTRLTRSIVKSESDAFHASKPSARAGSCSRPAVP